MKLTRRHFLAWAGLGALGAVACEGFGIREGELNIQSPVSLPEDLVRGKDNWYASLCRNGPSCEGILVRVMEGRAKKVQGNPAYPTNMGKSHARCEAGVQALYHPDRISGPMRRGGNRGSGRFDPIGWETGAWCDPAQLGAWQESGAQPGDATEEVGGSLDLQRRKELNRIKKRYGLRVSEEEFILSMNQI